MANKKPVKSKDKEEEKTIGRPPVITNECVGKLEEAFIRGYNVIQACKYAGIHRDTYYAYCKENPKFSDTIELLKTDLSIKAKDNIRLKITDGDVDLSKWYLERKNKDEFSTRSENINTEKPYVRDEEDEEMVKKSAMRVWGLVEKTN